MLNYERLLKKQGFDIIIGVDEAGRGPLAGPVVAAAVRLISHRFKNRIDDSKKLSSALREKAYLEIIDKSVFGIGIVGEKEIDAINILEASRLAMQKAILSLIDKLGENCNYKRIFIIADGNMSLNISLPVLSIIRGDSKSLSIASASIIAKVTRDRIMKIYDRAYPEYGFLKHKGYPTLMHRKRLKDIGLSPIHRKSFSFA
ncbi:MAG: ribonuclease HII [Candidatus Omnitrophota bacterium]